MQIVFYYLQSFCVDATTKANGVFVMSIWIRFESRFDLNVCCSRFWIRSQRRKKIKQVVLPANMHNIIHCATKLNRRIPFELCWAHHKITIKINFGLKRLDVPRIFDDKEKEKIALNGRRQKNTINSTFTVHLLVSICRIIRTYVRWSN